MIDRLINLTLTVIKSNVSIVLVFYVCGFLAFIAHYRVLGLPYISGNAQLYAEMAGRNIVVILQILILLASEPKYLVNIFQHLDWTGHTIYIWTTCIILLLIIHAILKYISHPVIITAQQNNYGVLLQLGLIIISVIMVFNVEIQPLYDENVLQAVKQTNTFTREKLNIINNEKQNNNKINYYDRLNFLEEQCQSKNFFAIVSTKDDQTGGDKKRFYALMLVVFIVTITAIILTCYRQHSFVKWLIYLFVVVQLLFIPFNYGVLGVKYEYPVVSLDYTAEKEKVLHKQAVFLLAKTQEHLIIYDRLNFLQIQYIPNSSVVNIEQQFTASPFSNCSDGEFKPCEFFAIQQ